MTDFATTHDPGGKVRLRLPEGMDGDASFGGDKGQFRHHLGRWANDAFASDRPNYALWIGMNPSTADWNVDDPTVRREVKYTRTVLGLDRYIKVNVMDYRCTNPARLCYMHPDERCSPANYRKIQEYARDADIVIAAWGTLHKSLRVHAVAVEGMLREMGIKLHCLGYTKDGSPRHPLYVKGDAPLLPYPREVA